MGLSATSWVDFPPEYSDWRDVEPAEAGRRRRRQVGDPGEHRRDAALSPARPRRLPSRLTTTARGTHRQGSVRTDPRRDGRPRQTRALLLDHRARGPERLREPGRHRLRPGRRGEARQIIDLVWGAALTRFLSLSARQLGNDFISVGRVQSPTLKLIVDREREIDAFDPEDYWEIFGDLTKGTNPSRPSTSTRPTTAPRPSESGTRNRPRTPTRPSPASIRRRSPRSVGGPAPTTRRTRSTPRRSSPRRVRWATPPSARCPSPRTSTPRVT